MYNEDIDTDSMITSFNTSVTETASEILGKQRQKKKGKKKGHCRNSWSVRQKERTKEEKIRTYRIWEMQESEVNNNIKKYMKKAKETWIGDQCSETEENLRRTTVRKSVS